MSEAEKTIRIIKKYPNRRVYDTHLSKYIKVDDLRDMVINGIDFQVIETQTKEDVTRSVLLQIILKKVLRCGKTCKASFLILFSHQSQKITINNQGQINKKVTRCNE